MWKHLITLSTILGSLLLSQNKDQINYLALGDSYTIGESVAVSERFPMQLVDSLRSLGCDISKPVIIAKTGWTTDELSTAIDEKEPVGKFDFVTLLIGVNNQYRGRAADEFRTHFSQLLKRSAGYVDSFKKVIVVSIPDWGVTPFATAKGRDPQKIASEIDRFNSIKNELAQKAGAHFIDITDISREASMDSSLLANDKLHPSAKMYSLWVKRILPSVKNIVGIK